MKKHLCSVCAIFPFFFGCIDSPLSDVEITDFGLITGSFIVDKYNSADVSVTATIRDKNSFGVHIKNGSVTVNGANMSYDDVAKIYKKNNLPVVKDSAYTFVITLSNGDTCASMVRTPKAEFGVVTCPDSLHILRDTAITWTDFAGAGTYLDYCLGVDSDADTIHLYEMVTQSSIVDTGGIALTHGLFDPAHDTGRGILTLKRRSTGKVSLLLRSGSDISSTFKWQKSLSLVQ
jgi:hypothetical protein